VLYYRLSYNQINVMYSLALTRLDVKVLTGLHIGIVSSLENMDKVTFSFLSNTESL
jgi:hypothetical protein